MTMRPFLYGVPLEQAPLVDIGNAFRLYANDPYIRDSIKSLLAISAELRRRGFRQSTVFRVLHMDASHLFGG